MSTVLQIVATLVGAAIVGGITYAFNLEKRISAFESLKVQMGEVSLPKTAETDNFWDASKGGGWRKTPATVTFQEPFKRQPVVMVALKRIDLGDFKSNIHRIGVRAENISQTGVQVYFETWNESLVFEAVVSWIAVCQ